MANIFDIFYKFFILGLVSFGGPIAHLGYFRKTFVEKLNWLSEAEYVKIVALSQFLPGPSSSQVGFTIGLKRGGLLGAFSAFVAFTLPSFLILYFLVVFGISSLENDIVTNTIQGLKLFAVVIVIDAVLSMYKNFCTDRFTIFLFIFSTVFLILFDSVFSQILVLILAAIFGLVFLDNNQKQTEITVKKTNKTPLILFLLLLFLLPFFSYLGKPIELFSSFYQAGSLVFGGGHVVLPLLQNSIGTLISNESFLVGYSLAQAVPGPMFTIASYLGADIFTESPFIGATIATIAIFLPGFLLILAFYESFESLTNKKKIVNMLTGINAAVVGLLASVLFTAVAPSGIHSLTDIIAVILGVFVLRKFKIPILYMILLFIALGFIY